MKHKPAYNYTGYKELSGIYWSQIKRGAESRGLYFDITIQQIWELFEKQNGKCALSGIDITIVRNPRKQTASLDRIDSSKGYTLNNIQWVHKDVNEIKMNLPEDKFIHLCEQIANHHFGIPNHIENPPPRPQEPVAQNFALFQSTRRGQKEYQIIGQRFGKLVVLQRVPNHNTRQSWWLCQCDCGNKIEIKGHRLVQRHIKSCGCLKSDRPSYNFKGYKNISGKYWRSICERAKERGLEVNITIEQAWDIFEKQKGLCALSGVPIFLKRHGRQTASLDRIDSSKGYTLDNVQWIRGDINKIKMDLSEERFIYLCEQIARTKAPLRKL